MTNIHLMERLQNLIYTLNNTLANYDILLFESYKVYDDVEGVLNDSNRDLLARLKDITLRNIYRNEYLNNGTPKPLYLDNPLFKKEDGKLYISHNLDYFIKIFIINSISNSIRDFLSRLESEQLEKPTFMLWNDDKSELTIRKGVQEFLFKDLEALEDISLILQLFSSSLKFNYFNNRGDLVVNMNEIEKSLDRLNDYNFETLIEKLKKSFTIE